MVCPNVEIIDIPDEQADDTSECDSSQSKSTSLDVAQQLQVILQDDTSKSDSMSQPMPAQSPIRTGQLEGMLQVTDDPSKSNVPMPLEQPSSSGTKKKRKLFSRSQLEFLERCFERFQYVPEELKESLAKEAGLTVMQLMVWFQNQRRRVKLNKTSLNTFYVERAPDEATPGIVIEPIGGTSSGGQARSTVYGGQTKATSTKEHGGQAHSTARGKVPSDWLKAVINPIPKDKGADQGRVPISHHTLDQSENISQDSADQSKTILEHRPNQVKVPSQRPQNPPSGKKIPRLEYKAEQLDYLESCFQENPFVRKEDKLRMAMEAGISEAQLLAWFQTRRHREKFPGMCAVCGDLALDVRYGVPACRMCKRFFQRATESFSNGVTFKCYFRNSCVTDKGSGSVCNACRLQECLVAGMRWPTNQKKDVKENPDLFQKRSPGVVTGGGMFKQKVVQIENCAPVVILDDDDDDDIDDNADNNVEDKTSDADAIEFIIKDNTNNADATNLDRALQNTVMDMSDIQGQPSHSDVQGDVVEISDEDE